MCVGRSARLRTLQRGHTAGVTRSLFRRFAPSVHGTRVKVERKGLLDEGEASHRVEKRANDFEGQPRGTAEARITGKAVGDG